MKILLINAVIYFIILTLLMLIVSTLTGIDGSIIIRIIFSLIIAYYNPIIKKDEKI